MSEIGRNPFKLDNEVKLPEKAPENLPKVDDEPKSKPEVEASDKSAENSKKVDPINRSGKTGKFSIQRIERPE